MRELGLTLRMAVASTVLLGVYVLVGLLLFGIGGIWAAVVGLPLLIAAQYIVAVHLPLWREKTQEITAETHPELYQRAESIADELEIAMPQLYLAEFGVMNAFAVGRRGSGKVFLSRSLIRGLSMAELEPVLAHEFAHLKNRDSIVMSFGTTIVSVISSVLFLLFLIASLDADRPWLVRAVGAVVSVCVHIFLLIFVRILSRYREYVADEIAVTTTGQYDGMTSALNKIERDHTGRDAAEMSATRSAISFVGDSGGVVGRLLATHPAPDNRISRIERLRSEVGTSGATSQPSTTDASSATRESSSTNSTGQLSDQQLISELRSMDAYAFERLISDLWSELGWRTTVTTASADKGIDVIAERDSPFYQKQLIQVKRYGPENPVSSSEIQQYAGLHVQEDDVDAVVVVTTGRFTSNAQEVAADSNVKLIDGEGLCEMIRSPEVDLFLDTYLGS